MKPLFAAAAAAIAAFSISSTAALAGGGHHEFRPHPGWNDEVHPRPHRHRPHGQFSFGFSFGTPGFYVQPRPHYRPAPVIHISRAHIAWCYDRYRSYRHHDNTFATRAGFRQHCVSPYLYR